MGKDGFAGALGLACCFLAVTYWWVGSGGSAAASAGWGGGSDGTDTLPSGGNQAHVYHEINGRRRHTMLQPQPQPQPPLQPSPAGEPADGGGGGETAVLATLPIATFAVGPAVVAPTITGTIPGAAGAAASLKVERIGDHKKCPFGVWLNEHPATAEGCGGLVIRNPACSSVFFGYADHGDSNCMCLPEALDCATAMADADVQSVYRILDDDAAPSAPPPLPAPPVPLPPPPPPPPSKECAVIAQLWDRLWAKNPKGGDTVVLVDILDEATPRIVDRANRTLHLVHTALSVFCNPATGRAYLASRATDFCYCRAPRNRRDRCSAAPKNAPNDFPESRDRFVISTSVTVVCEIHDGDSGGNFTSILGDCNFERNAPAVPIAETTPAACSAKAYLTPTRHTEYGGELYAWRGEEDPRLFVWRGEVWVSFTHRTCDSGDPDKAGTRISIRQVTGGDGGGGGTGIVKGFVGQNANTILAGYGFHTAIKRGGRPDPGRRTEKNWIFFDEWTSSGRQPLRVTNMIQTAADKHLVYTSVGEPGPDGLRMSPPRPADFSADMAKVHGGTNYVRIEAGVAGLTESVLIALAHHSRKKKGAPKYYHFWYAIAAVAPFGRRGIITSPRKLPVPANHAGGVSMLNFNPETAEDFSPGTPSDIQFATGLAKVGPHLYVTFGDDDCRGMMARFNLDGIINSIFPDGRR